MEKIPRKKTPPFEGNGHARSSLIISRYKKRRRERERVKEEG